MMAYRPVKAGRNVSPSTLTMKYLNWEDGQPNLILHIFHSLNSMGCAIPHDTLKRSMISRGVAFCAAR
jgi:hypothetical protein